MAMAPGLLVVQGDTSSAMGGALAGFAANVPVAHVEAGLRTHDPDMPWPEEGYRVAIDARSELLFAPTAGNADNLRREGVPGEIHVTGNPGIDALLGEIAHLPPVELRDVGRTRLLVTCHRRENWGARLADVAAALTELAASQPLGIRIVLHPNPQVAKATRELLRGSANVALIDPLPPAAMIRAMARADIILSDSGGVQEEAPALGVPLLVLREKTERPEGIASGNMLLVGTDPERIRDEAIRLMDPIARAAMAKAALPFGDGRAAPRIAAVIARYVERLDTSAKVKRSA